MRHGVLTLIQKQEYIEKLTGMLGNVILLEFVSSIHCFNFTKI